MKNLGGGFTWKTSDILKTLHGKQNKWIFDMSTRGFLIEISLHKYNVEQKDVISRMLPILLFIVLKL